MLDTNIVSELRRPKPHGAVVSWINNTDERALYLSAVTLGEIQAGIEVTREQDATKAVELERWADQVAASFNILAADDAVFRAAAKLLHRKPAVLHEDALIAATAQIHRLEIVTRNTRDFATLGFASLSPFPV